MRSNSVLRFGCLLLLASLISCGGGGSGSSSGSGTPPPVRTLLVATQPAGGTAPAALSTQPVVHVRSNGVTAATDNSTIVTASIAPGTGTAGATLGGTLTATAAGGVATFTNLSLDTA